MLGGDQGINRYGAKFFIRQLVRIVKVHGDMHDEDVGKVGVIDEIIGDIHEGFEYALGESESNMRAWFDETDLDFVESEDRMEWEENGKHIQQVLRKHL